MVDADTFAFIQTHLHGDPQRLLLSAHRYPGVDVRLAAQQIEARQRIKEKLPQWYAHPSVVFPSSVACQQASSQETARYKQRLVQEGEVVIDATGGLGVDSAAFATKAAHVIYIEQNDLLCRTAEYNFKALGMNNISTIHSNCMDVLENLPPADLLYIDPSRRSVHQKRLYALSDCEPDVTAIRQQLLNKARRVLVKISPMADICQTLRLLPETVQVHVVSVKNECKELLFLLERTPSTQEIPIICVDLGQDGDREPFLFTFQEESAAKPLLLSKEPDGFLYEPNASLLKGGAFKLLSTRYGLQKLHPNTHLYTSPTLLPSFPGRVFRITHVMGFNKQVVHTLYKTMPLANVAVRNFCMEAKALQKRLKIKDGGGIYLFGVTLSDNSYALIAGTHI